MVPPRPTRASRSYSAAVPPGCDLYIIDEEGIKVGLEDFEPNSSMSTDDDMSFTTAQSSLKEETEAVVTNLAPKGHLSTEPGRETRRPPSGIDGSGAKISAFSPDTREVHKRTRPPRRQRVIKRRPRGYIRVEGASPSVQRVLHSSRSSRRDPTQELWFLADDGTTCAAARRRRR